MEDEAGLLGKGTGCGGLGVQGWWRLYLTSSNGGTGVCMPG